MIYMDNAATSWPKPQEVLRAMTDFLQRAGGNPGRAGHGLSIEAGRVVYETRELVAEFFGAPDPSRVVFTPNVTYALNLAMIGLLRPGDHVVTTGIEHNAVMRPLRELERGGVEITVVPCAGDGQLDPLDVRRAVRPDTRLLVMNHASNVMGTISPIAAAATEAHAVGALVLVDAAQTAGVVPIDVQAMDIDLLAFTGHKGLQGPPGTGGLIIAESVDADAMQPLIRGGTGSNSEFEEQPTMLPDKFESGTANGVGIAGLQAGIRAVRDRGIDTIRGHEVLLTRKLVHGLCAIPNVTVYGPDDAEDRTAVVSCAISGKRVSEIGFRLSDEYGILCRVGLHCAPAAHRTIGTYPEGTVRLALGLFTTAEEVEATVAAVRDIATG